MNPLSIYQDALDVVSRATLAGDFAGYLEMMDLPYLLCTLEADFVLHTPEELEPVFRSVHDALQKNEATHYERIAREASFARADRIEGWHFTHVIAHGERVIAPWAARQALVLRPQGWRFSEAHYPFHADRLPFSEAVLRGALRPDKGPGTRAPASPLRRDETEGAS